MLLLTLITLNTLSKGEEKGNTMTKLIVKKISTKKAGKDSLLEMTLCNTSDSKYFLEKRFVFTPEDNALVGFEVSQDGKELDYMGISNKAGASQFPNDYVTIDPKDCITFTVMLNKFFTFNQDKEFVLTYFIMNSNPLTDELDEISFDDKKITIGK